MGFSKVFCVSACKICKLQIKLYNYSEITGEVTDLDSYSDKDTCVRKPLTRLHNGHNIICQCICKILVASLTQKFLENLDSKV